MLKIEFQQVLVKKERILVENLKESSQFIPFIARS